MRKHFLSKEDGLDKPFEYNPYSILKKVKEAVKNSPKEFEVPTSSEHIVFEEFETYMKENKIFFHKQCLFSFFAFFKEEDGITLERLFK